MKKKMMDLIIPDDDLEVTGTETTYEMNFPIFKIKRTVKKNKSPGSPL